MQSIDPAITAPDPRGGWSALAVTMLARCLLLVVAGLLFWSLFPTVFGWKPTVVMSGSMEPSVHVGSVVLSRPVPADQLKPGQVLLVDSPDRPGELRLHRFVRVAAGGKLVLRGDANRTEDSTPVARSAVHGVGVLQMPRIATPVVWAQEGKYGYLGVTAVLLALALKLAFYWRADDEDDDEDDEPARGRHRRPRRSVRQVAVVTIGRVREAAVMSRTAAVTVAVLGVTIAVAPPADAAIYTTTTAASSTWAASTYFDCTNAVGPSPGLAGLFAYPLAETTGTYVTDVSGSNRPGVYNSSGITYGAAGPCATDGGRAITLDGSSGYAITGTPLTTTTTGSISIWFKTTVSGGKLMGYQDSNNHYDRMLYLTDTGAVVLGTASASLDVVTSPETYLDGQWHHAVGTYAPNGNANPGLRLYIDGTLVAFNASPPAPTYTYSGYVAIGGGYLSGWPSAPSRTFYTGSLAYTSAYASALTPDQVTAMYQSVGGQPPGGTLANVKIEAETLIGTAGGNAGTARVQNQQASNPWSGGKQLEFNQMNNNQYGTLTFNVASAGTYAFIIRWSLYPDYGIHTVYIDGTVIGPSFDNYTSVSTGQTASVNYGNVYFSAGSHTMAILATGKNPSSSFYDVGIDFFSMQQISRT